MPMTNTKTVFTANEISIVRVQSYGFRCNTLSSDWEVHMNGVKVQNFLRLKDAKKAIANGYFKIIKLTDPAKV